MTYKLCFGLLSVLTLGATEYFVSCSGNDTNSGTSPEAAFRTIQKAANLTAPGDIVTVMNGEYTNSCAACSVVDITRSGSPDAWIVYRAYEGHKPLLRFNGWHGFQIRSGASYIEILGFDLRGGRTSQTFEFCRAERQNSNPLCNGNGITADGRNDGERKPHHIRIANNRVWQCAGGGINAIQADYITIEDNIVHENAWHARFANSGINIYQAWNSDSETTTKIIIRRNRVFNNRSLVDWFATNRLSDGNGIIIDDLRNTQNSSQLGPYKGAILVENNLSFNNGGAGIQAYLSDRIDFINNTTYLNGQVVDYGEIRVNQCSAVRILNNIAVARPNGRAIEIIRGVDVFSDYNLAFGGSVSSPGPNDLIADPLFLSPSTEWALSDFRPSDKSPAKESGDPSLLLDLDLDRKPRPSAGRVSRGALEPLPQ